MTNFNVDKDCGILLQTCFFHCDEIELIITEMKEEEIQEMKIGINEIRLTLLSFYKSIPEERYFTFVISKISDLLQSIFKLVLNLSKKKFSVWDRNDKISLFDQLYLLSLHNDQIEFEFLNKKGKNKKYEKFFDDKASQLFWK